MTEQEYELLKKTILKLTDINLDFYKPQQMRRRLTGLVSSQASSVAEYRKLLESDENALTKLKTFLTINVSEFFRDSVQFEVLKTTILPDLLERRPSLNVWSAGCSHGGEPYSVAMLLEELAPNRNHKILGTDLDDNVLARAQKGGPYDNSDVSNVPPKLLLKHFTKSPDGYEVAASIKQKVNFKRHNLLRDHYGSGFDLVICRNVVIYFSDEAKTQLYKGFHSSLRDGGIMFIGATETLLGASDLGFERSNNCFYRKTSPYGVARPAIKAASV